MNTATSLQHDSGIHTLCAVGGVEFLESLKKDLSPENQLLVNDILDQVYITSSNVTEKCTNVQDLSKVPSYEPKIVQPADDQC